MADTFQGMTANRSTGMTRARLMQHYKDLGFSPEVAAQKAEAEMAFRTQSEPMDYGTGDSPREAGAVRTANDAIAQRREMNDRDLGAENIDRMQQVYRSNPMLLGLDEPNAQLDQFRETAPTTQDIAAQVLRDRAQGDANRAREVATPWYEMQAYRNEPSAIEARRQAAASFEPNLRQNSEQITQADEEQRKRDAIYDRQNAASQRLDSATTPTMGVQPPAQAPNASVATAPAGGSQLVDRVSPDARADIAAQQSSLPMFARPNWGAETVAPNVQDRSVSPGLLAMAGNKIAPYSMQNSPADMRFSTDKAPAAPAAPARRSIPGAGDPLPVRRPDSIGQLPGSQTAPQQGFLSRIFGQDPYAGKSASQLMASANQDPDNAAAFFRADKALQKEQPDMFQSAPTEKRGGAIKGNAGSGKDAALHKALEIIHHMITRGR